MTVGISEANSQDLGNRDLESHDGEPHSNDRGAEWSRSSGTMNSARLECSRNLSTTNVLAHLVQ
jgi:hypothetical protein